MLLGSGGSLVDAEPPIFWVRALDAATGVRKWEYRAPSHNEFRNHSGLLATAGGLVFGASSGVLFALDGATGHELWRLPVGANVLAAPVSFNLEGRQMIAILAGQSLIVLGL